VNLADAIRQASSQLDPSGSAAWVEQDTEAQETRLRKIQARTPEPTPAPPTESEVVEAADAAAAAGGFGSVVRLELTLSPEQLSGLFRAILANQHSVMTLKEAAQYLRIPPVTLEQMANEGEVPAFRIDGRWRFSHNALDEWLTLNRPKQGRGA